MDDAALFALCLYSEACGEPDDGKEAVAQVVLNRMRLKYQSDGTVQGTVLHPGAFSGFWYDFGPEGYHRAAWTLSDAEARSDQMLARAKGKSCWPECVSIAQMALSGRLEPPAGLSDAVLYLNPAILPKLPAWACAANKLCAIGHHTFYRDAA